MRAVSLGLRRAALVVALLLLACSRPRPAPPAARTGPVLVAVDVFGTDPATGARILARVGAELRGYGEAAIREDVWVDPGPVMAKVRALGDFVYVEPSLVGYFADDGMRSYLTVDVVERRDASRRLAFAPAPTGAYPDPDGVVALWARYDATVMELMGAGSMSPDRVPCAAWHCLGDASHPAVRSTFAALVARVPAQLEAVTTILRDDADARRRGAAAYLLGFGPDGDEVVRRLVPAFRDPSGLVRNNAMRVVADIATYHPEVDVPLAPVLDALELPATTDRNKAAAILAARLTRPVDTGTRCEVLTRAGATLRAMRALAQPNNRDFADAILRRLGGDHGGCAATQAQPVPGFPRDAVSG